MSSPADVSRRNIPRLLLLLSGVLFLLGAILHNRWTVGLVVRATGALFHLPIALPDAHHLHRTMLAYLIAAAVCVGLSTIIARVPALDRWFRRAWVEKLVLAMVVVVVPVAWLEIGLRTFAPESEKSTTIFERDRELGWKLRPGAVDEWGGVRVSINDRGYRGPVVPYARTPGTRRILYLGDSVTFGYTIAHWQDTFPALTGSLLAAKDSIPVETVNLSVGGYSQWQEAIQLREEGMRYAPDLVVVGFVLNDVTEMFHLARFGGSNEGFQIGHGYTSLIDRVLSHSALAYEIRRFAIAVEARRRLGKDPRLGAIRQEALEVQTLIRSPDQPNVKTAWDIALADLQRIVDLCRARDVPVMIVVFPFSTQLNDPAGLSAPQQVIDSYAHAHDIPVVDLLPELADTIRSTGASPSDLFVDHDHLTIEGHRVVAGLLVDPVAALLSSRAP